MLSWNSDDINHTSVVPKGWFNQYWVHRVSVREPFIHITFYFSGRCSYELCTRAIKQHLSYSGKRCAKDVLHAICFQEINREDISDFAWCLHSSTWTRSGTMNRSIWNTSLKIGARSLWGLKTIYFYRRQSGVISFSMMIFQKKKMHEPFKVCKGVFLHQHFPILFNHSSWEGSTRSTRS